MAERQKKAAAAATTRKVKSTSKSKAETSKDIASSYLPYGVKPYPLKDGEEYMNEPQRKHFKEILAAWKQKLMEDVDHTVVHLQSESGNRPDPTDRASQETEFAMELRTRDRERKLIKKIEAAYQQIENEEYGYCEECGEPIGIRRLEARPTASLCIDCKTFNEIKEKQLGNT